MQHLNPSYPPDLAGGYVQNPEGAAAVWRGLELLFKGIADMHAPSGADTGFHPIPPAAGPWAPFAGAEPPAPSLYPSMDDTSDAGFPDGWQPPFPAPQAPVGHPGVTGTTFAAPDAEGLRAFLRAQGVPEHMLEQAMSFAPPMAAPAPPAGPPPPAPTPYPVPQSDCEEATQQRQDATRVAKLRADPQLFLEKVFYYLTQIAVLRDEHPDTEVAETHGAQIDSLIESIDCLPGTCPGPSTWSNPPSTEQSELASVWDGCYALLNELMDQSICDGEDQAVVLHTIGERAIPLPPPAPRAAPDKAECL